jgi:hypothetical protein
MSADSDLLTLMNAVVESLGDSGDTLDTLARITHAARDTVPGADYASISVRRPDGRLETLAPTSPLVATADLLQNELHEGPCYDVVTDEQEMYAENLATDTRWPTYGRRASELGLCSQLAMRLHTEPGTAVGLNLYSRETFAFDDAHQVAEIFVSHAKVALGYAHEVEGLRAAVSTRTIIGTAVGIVMERYTLNDERAFEFLIRVSQRSNIKLRDVASGIVAAAAEKAASQG